MAAEALTKRERTRDKLLVSAQELVMARGLSAITIHDIAAHADVAPGTFYNYFRTREDVADTIADVIERAYHRDVDAITASMTDPVRIVAASIRQTMVWAEPGGAIGRLMFMSGLPNARFVLGVRERAGRDVRAGIAAGAFRADDVEATLSVFAGAMIGVLLDLFLGVLPSSASANVTEQCLCLLGVPKAKAKNVANATFDLRASPRVPLVASEWLGPIEGVIESADTRGGLAAWMPTDDGKPRRRPRVSRSLRKRV